MTFSVKISFQGGLRDVNEVILSEETKLRNQIDIFQEHSKFRTS